MASSERARYAVYARYSTAQQNPRSIEDQVALCRRHVAGRDVDVTVYVDRAETGTSMHGRSGLAELLRACDDGEVDVVLAEALDRISRDLADLASLYKRWAYRDVVLETVQEGVVNPLHVGLKGVMNEEFVAALVAKTRRGMEGNIRAGRAAGGVSYGYRAAPRIDADGRVVRGLREIVPEQAEVVRRIFRWYAAGRGSRWIAARLNAEGIPAPRGGEWKAITITGHRQRRNGIVCNDLYRGVLMFGRTRSRRDPGTGRRRTRTVDRSEWTVTQVEELRIVDDDLWDRVQLRRDAGQGRGAAGRRGDPRPLTARMRCGHCGGRATIHNAARYSCLSRREGGLCDSRGSVPVAAVEAAALARLGEFVAHGADWPAVLGRADETLEAERRTVGKRIAATPSGGG